MRTIALFLFFFHTLFLFVQFPLALRCLQTLWGCIYNSGKAITQSLQIFMGGIGYNVAWKWLGAEKAFSQAQQIITVLLRLEARDFSACLVWVSGCHRSGSYSFRTVNCARKHLLYYFDSVSQYLFINITVHHRDNKMSLERELLWITISKDKPEALPISSSV